MEIIKAKAMGMCFGVKDALSRIFKIGEPKDYTVYGDLVHNSSVMENIKNLGFQVLTENERTHIPASSKIIVTAHGLSNKTKKSLEEQGKTLIDTTCPLVNKIHKQAIHHEEEGYTVLLLGKKNHVEVQGIAEDLKNVFIIEKEEDIWDFKVDKVVVLCQSTSSKKLVKRLYKKIVHMNPESEVKFLNTICKPTLERQDATDELLKEVEALVVVGGKNSNNTRQLVKSARSKGIEAFHVEKSSELQFSDIAHFEKVGLTAGSSTPDSIIDTVYQKLLSFANKKNFQKI